MAFFANLTAKAYRIWRNLPLLPLTALCLLLGLSIYASLQGGSSGPSTTADAAPEVARSHTSANGEARSPRAGIAQAAVANASCSLQNATYAGRILKSGSLNIKPSSEACWKECKHTEKCNAWTWCADELGCMDENGHLIPFKGCQLKDEPMQAWGLPSQRQVASHKIANYFSGYLRHRKPHQRTFIRLHSAPLTTLMVATYVPPSACSADKGDLFTLLGIMNKQDYARWHSCEFVLGAKTFDPSLRPPGHPEEGTWNKVGMLRKLLEDTPPRRAEWILFMQPDAIIDDTSFTFPFESYRDKDFILLGNATQLRNGQFRLSVERGGPAAADLGVFVLRNSRWTRRLLDMLAEEARNHPTSARALQEEVALDPVAAALARLIQRMPDRMLPKMHFEGDFCIGCDWRRINLTESSKVETTKEWGEDNKRWNLFITRFYDCELCDAGRGKEPLSKCHKSYLEHYDFAFCRFHRLIKAIHREEETGHPLKMMINDLGIPKASLNESSFDWPCWEACIKDEKCSMWVWCNYRNGCDDNGNFDGTFPYRGCQLMSLEKGIPVQQWYRGPQFSSVMSGFITGM
ncbi:probable glycosyltransferase 2 [Coccomyxa sp. Obi]|nr:probable glycosyltransferase 2 [Coccomyxa sp. Obi]